LRRESQQPAISFAYLDHKRERGAGWLGIPGLPLLHICSSRDLFDHNGRIVTDSKCALATRLSYFEQQQLFAD
jgi:hypothetical protein